MKNIYLILAILSFGIPILLGISVAQYKEYQKVPLVHYYTENGEFYADSIEKQGECWIVKGQSNSVLIGHWSGLFCGKLMILK